MDIKTAYLFETYRSDHRLAAHDTFLIAVPGHGIITVRNVLTSLNNCGYNATQIEQMVYSLPFTTPRVFFGLQDHEFLKYMQDDVDFSTFLAKLFN